MKSQSTLKLFCDSHKQSGSVQPGTDLANSRKDLDVWQWKLALLQDKAAWSQKKTEAPNYVCLQFGFMLEALSTLGEDKLKGKKSPRNLLTEWMKASALSDMVNEVSLVLKAQKTRQGYSFALSKTPSNTGQKTAYGNQASEHTWSASVICLALRLKQNAHIYKTKLWSTPCKCKVL